LVIAAYAAAVLWIGVVAKRGHETAADLVVGRRSLPTWAVLASMVATELSAATFLGVPEASYTGTWSYLELAFGALLGKVAISAHVIPLYHRLGVVSIYQLLEQRFGPRAQRVAALCFMAGRILASGVRLFIAALAFSAVTGTSIPTYQNQPTTR
jgi:SSS family solute:Na+ symporter